MSDNEKLIEEAAKAIMEASHGEGEWEFRDAIEEELYLRRARAALSVFEKAHTVPGAQGEPSGAHCDGCASFQHHHCYHCGKLSGLPHPAWCENSGDAVGRLREVLQTTSMFNDEVEDVVGKIASSGLLALGEWTDFQVSAAIEAFHGRPNWVEVGDETRMRAALRAASAVTERGEVR